MGSAAGRVRVSFIDLNQHLPTAAHAAAGSMRRRVNVPRRITHHAPAKASTARSTRARMVAVVMVDDG